MTIKIMLVDDHLRVHQGITAVMEAFDDLELIGQAGNGQEAIELCGALQPDVVIMDVLMPDMDGIEATRRIHELYPEIKIMALSSLRDAEAVRAMLQAGAVGYLLKNSSIDDLAQTIQMVHAGKAIFSAELTSLFMQMEVSTPPGKDYGLTPREREILKLMVDGLNNTEIAETLTISVSTAKFHVSSIMTKLRVGNRIEAVALAVQEKLLS